METQPHGNNLSWSVDASQYIAREKGENVAYKNAVEVKTVPVRRIDSLQTFHHIL